MPDAIVGVKPAGKVSLTVTRPLDAAFKLILLTVTV